MQTLLCLCSAIVNNREEPSSEDHEASNHENQLFESQESFDRQQYSTQDARNANFENNLDAMEEESAERVSHDDADSPVGKHSRQTKPYTIPLDVYHAFSGKRQGFLSRFVSAVVYCIPCQLKRLPRLTTRFFRGRPYHPVRKGPIKWSFWRRYIVILLLGQACLASGSVSTPLNKTRALLKQSGARQKSSEYDDTADAGDRCDWRFKWRLECLTCVVVASVLLFCFLAARLPSADNRRDATPLPAQLSPQQVKPGSHNIVADPSSSTLTTPAFKLHLSTSPSPPVPDPEIPPPTRTHSDRFESVPNFVEPVLCDDTGSRELITEAKSVVLSEERWREACGGGLFEGKQPVLVIEGGTFKLDNIAATTSIGGGAGCVPLDRLVLPRAMKGTLVGDLNRWPDACVRPDEPEQPDSSVPAIAELDPPEGNEDAEENEDADVNSWVIPQQEVSNLPFPTEVSSKGRHVHSELVVEKAAISLPPLESMVLSKPSHPHLPLLPLQEIAAVHQGDPEGAQQGHQPRNQASQDQPADLEAEKKVKECFPCIMDHSVVRAFCSLAPE